ncbi:RNA polymerase sigma factor [Clostridium grantii]|uniref:RNA polymerase sigma factor, sigma-70 family n=1 Tax=Clostridium grantii DSM 8605 TaxID=1121316 RepID=A0A1M5WH00_9CLOT|nr:RNA polymerase sigma factor [Clostridium grantii]SHH86755.1 RNA polymerase sigma factor, sigma-70 family [Clostridium grantii DSM 8605]
MQSVDDIIIKKAAKGDKEAFRIIVEHYKNLVFAACYKIVKDPHEAENLTQETFLKIYKSISQYRYEGFNTWVMRIAVNKAIDSKRKMIKIKEREINNVEVINFIKDPKLSVQDQLIKKEEAQQLIACCNELPDKYSKIINLYYIKNKSCQEIALEESINVKTVQTRLSRGRKLLKDALEGVISK